MKSKTKSKRLSILSSEEVELYFGLPKFSNTERSHYFTMTDKELKLSKTLASQTQWYFILQLSYFKAKKQFFIISYRKAKSDIDFITNTYRCKKPHKDVSEDTHRKVREMILSHFNFSDNLNAIKAKLMDKGKDIVASTTDPKALFKVLYDCTTESKWIIPGYSAFQNIISNTLKQEALRLQNILQKLMPQYAVKAMNKLLSVDKQYYEMTSIQNDQKNFKYNEVQKIIEHKRNYNRLYHVSKNVIPKLKITRSMIAYYASLASHHPISKLKKLPKYTAYLYLLCYISSRIEKFNDNLMNSFVYYVDRYKKSAKEFGKNCVYESKLQLNREVKTKVPKVMELIIGRSSPDKTIQEKALSIASKEKLVQLIDYIANDKLDEHYFRWQHYDEKQAEITKNLRPIFMNLDFKFSDACKNLSKAIAFLKVQFEQNKPLSKINNNHFPTAFIPNNISDYIYQIDKDHRVTEISYAQYEFCVYAQIRKEFKNNNVTIYDSMNHKSLTDDLVPHHKRKAVIKQLNNPLLSTTLKEALPISETTLDQYYHEVNKRIKSGENKSAEIDLSGTKPKIILKYNKKDDLTNHRFFKTLPKISIIDVLNFVLKKTNFIRRFSHIKPNYSKAKQDVQYILGVIIANAIHQGIGGMSKMSNLGRGSNQGNTLACS